MRSVKFLVSAAASIGALLSVAPASAADMAAKAPYMSAPPAFNWSGFYAGVHAGYNWSSNDWISEGIVENPFLFLGAAKPKTDGALGGIQVGANAQLGNWVVGVEGDFALLARKGSDFASLPANFQGAATVTSKIDWLAQFTARAGYAFDRTLFYFKGGVAAGGAKDGLVISSIGGAPVFGDLGTHSNILVGYTVGGGVEHFFSPNFSAKIEYNYVDLGSTSEKFGNLNVVPFTIAERIEHKLQIVKVGGNYKF